MHNNNDYCKGGGTRRPGDGQSEPGRGLWLLLGRRRRDAEQQRRCENKQIVRFVLNVINDMIDDYVVRFTFEFVFFFNTMIFTSLISFYFTFLLCIITRFKYVIFSICYYITILILII